MITILTQGYNSASFQWTLVPKLGTSRLDLNSPGTFCLTGKHDRFFGLLIKYQSNFGSIQDSGETYPTLGLSNPAPNPNPRPNPEDGSRIPRNLDWSATSQFICQTILNIDVQAKLEEFDFSSALGFVWRAVKVQHCCNWMITPFCHDKGKTYIITCNKKTNSIWAPSVPLGRNLHFWCFSQGAAKSRWHDVIHSCNNMIPRVIQ